MDNLNKLYDTLLDSSLDSGPDAVRIATKADELTEPHTPATPEMTNEAVHEFLMRHTGIESLAVVDAGRPIGLINRHVFMEQFSRAYGREIYGKRSCLAFMYKSPLIVEADCPIESLVKAAVQEGGGALRDGFIVTRKGQYHGIGTAYELLKAMSDIEAEKTRQLMSSINYASLIQQSHLADSNTALNANFSDYGLLWEPRDVVGGDAYFFRQTNQGLIGCTFDCTGHGVPGAFMTLIVMSFLEHLIDTKGGELEPGEVLSRMHRYIRRVLQQGEGTTKVSNDGLDAFFFKLSDDRTKMRYASAKLSLIICDGTDAAPTTAEGDKAGIGYNDTHEGFEWSTHEIEVVPGKTLLTIPSDGVIDQIGGPKSIAHGKRRLIEFLSRHSTLPSKEVTDRFKESFAVWQGEQRRRDDVSLFVFRP